ncbi:MAG: PTS system mannose/fructose/sorbose family transporter subunit IID [Lachnospiraceae bacterium]|nr:PTS system mannose/fructose/sorbose family transporter subunit IID [Lachnospiraceae bacterium]
MAKTNEKLTKKELCMEEERALGKEVDDEIITATKTSLMGPLAGIGDSMIPGVIIPILLAIAMAISAKGSVLGPLFYIVTYLALIVVGSHYLFFKGYHLGVSATDLIMGERSTQIRDAVTIVGVIVMGAIAAGNINFSINLTLADVSIQGMFDSIYPKILPLGLVLGSWMLLKKTKLSTMALIGILVVISFVFAALGIF